MGRPSASRVAAVANLLDISRDVFLGIPPDGGDWHGGPPKIHVSFSGTEASKVQARDTTVVADLQSGDDGVYLDHYLVMRFLKVYPGAEDALVKAASDYYEMRDTELHAQIRDHYGDPAFKFHLLSDVFGFRGADEWENPSNVKVLDTWIGPVKFVGRGIFRAPWKARVTFQATKKAPVTEAPFTKMPDRELDKLIAKWESEAPENFWMDGELRLSRPAAYKMYRDRWRKMSPRDQSNMLKSLR